MNGNYIEENLPVIENNNMINVENSNNNLNGGIEYDHQRDNHPSSQNENNNIPYEYTRNGSNQMIDEAQQFDPRIHPPPPPPNFFESNQVINDPVYLDPVYLPHLEKKYPPIDKYHHDKYNDKYFSHEKYPPNHDRFPPSHERYAHHDKYAPHHDKYPPHHDKYASHHDKYAPHHDKYPSHHDKYDRFPPSHEKYPPHHDKYSQQDRFPHDKYSYEKFPPEKYNAQFDKYYENYNSDKMDPTLYNNSPSFSKKSRFRSSFQEESDKNFFGKSSSNKRPRKTKEIKKIITDPNELKLIELLDKGEEFNKTIFEFYAKSDKAILEMEVLQRELDEINQRAKDIKNNRENLEKSFQN